MKKQLLTYFLSSALFHFSFGQSFSLDWADNVYQDAYGGHVAVDSDGDIFVAGYNGSDDLIISKYSPNGTLINSLSIVSNGDASGQALISIDGDDNLIVAGNFGGTVDFNPGAGTLNLTGEYTSFLAKFYNDLNAVSFAIATQDDRRPSAMDLDADGNIYVSYGHLFGGDSDAVIEKYDNGGAFQWDFVLQGNNGYVEVTGLDANELGEFYISGYLYSVTSPPDFNPDPNAVFTNIAGDMFFAKYSADKEFQWAKGFINDHNQLVVKYHANQLILAGEGYGDIDPNSGVLNVSETFFWGIYNSSNGSIIGGREIELIGTSGSNEAGFIQDIDVMDEGQIVLTGYTSSGDSIDFDANGPSAAYATIGGGTGFVAVYDCDWIFLDAILFPTTDVSRPSSSCLNGNKLYVGGYYYGITDFDPNGTYDLTASTNDPELFIGAYDVEFQPCLTVDVSVTVEALDFSIYPNPSYGQFTLKLNSDKKCQVDVFNALGQSLFTKQLNSIDRASINLLTAGIYHVVVRTEESTFTEKIVVQ